MRKQNSISLIVLNHNGLEHLDEYFTSVFRQTFIPNEIILFDNGSTDGSIEYVSKKFPRVKIIKNRFNAGTAQGSNIAFNHTTSDYVIFQSNDIRLDRNCLKALIESVSRDPMIGICTSVVLYYGKDSKGKYRIENAGGLIDRFSFNWPAYNAKEIRTIPKVGEIFLTYGASFIIRRELFKRIDGFDEALFTLNDDVDLSWRVRLQGYRVVYTADSIVFHKGHSTLGPIFSRAQKRYWSERNCLRTLLKNYSIISLLRYLPGYLGILLGEMTFYLYRGRFDLFFAVLKALGWNLYQLPDTRKKRQKTQKSRKVSDQEITKLMHRKSFKLLYRNAFKKSI